MPEWFDIGKPEVAGGAAILAAIWAALQILQNARKNRFEERKLELRDDSGALAQAVARLRSRDPLGFYRDSLQRILGFLDRHLGRGLLLLHWRGLGWAAFLALIYVPLLFLGTILVSETVPVFAVVQRVDLAALGGLLWNLWLVASLVSWLAIGAFSAAAMPRIDATLRGAVERCLLLALGRNAEPRWTEVALAIIAVAATTSVMLMVTPDVAFVMKLVVIVSSVVVRSLIPAVFLATGFLIGAALPHANVVDIQLLMPLFAMIWLNRFIQLFETVSEIRLEESNRFPLAAIALLTYAIISVFLSPLHVLVGATWWFANLALLGLLPAVNALADWVSVAISRALAEHLLRLSPAQRVPWGRLGLHLFADVLAAIALLLLLAFLLPFAVTLHPGAENFTESRILPGWPLTFPDAYACATAQDPFGYGLWATIMLASTLLPTVLHLTLVLASPVMFHLTPGGDLLRLLRQVPEDGRVPKDLALEGALPLAIARYEQRQYWRAIIVGGLLAGTVIVTTAYGIYLLLNVAATDLLGLPEARPTALLLWFAFGFDRERVAECLLYGGLGGGGGPL